MTDEKKLFKVGKIDAPADVQAVHSAEEAAALYGRGSDLHGHAIHALNNPYSDPARVPGFRGGSRMTDETKPIKRIDFAALANAARSLSSARGGEKQPTGPDVLVVRFGALTMRAAVELALRPMDGHAVPFRVHGVKIAQGGAVVDVEVRLDIGTEQGCAG